MTDALSGVALMLRYEALEEIARLIMHPYLRERIMMPVIRFNQRALWSSSACSEPKSEFFVLEKDRLFAMADAASLLEDLYRDRRRCFTMLATDCLRS